VNPQRLARETYKCKDGTIVPQGSILTFANLEHQLDPTVFPEPLAFDPMRCYRKRQENNKVHGYLAGQTSPNNLGFGYGGQACAGRQFAVAEIKLLVARLLYEFEFKMPEGKSRPNDIHVNELTFLPPSAKVMMRKKRVVTTSTLKGQINR
jgi:ent-kaurene oxidase